MDIKGQAFLVTGGASGLGAATVKLIAANGGRVAIADLNADLGNALAKETGGIFIKCDVTSESDGQAAVDATMKAYGGIHGLVNCAGIGTAEKTTGKNGPHNLAGFTRVIQINLIGTFLMMAKASVGMLGLKPVNADGERGVMINTASVAAQDGQIGQVAYAASKGGVAAMTLPVARDLSRDGIRVMAILPGLFQTPMFDGLPEEAQRALAASVPFPSRLGSPAEYAQLACHIAENGMLNGECIRLDGAVRLAPR